MEKTRTFAKENGSIKAVVACLDANGREVGLIAADIETLQYFWRRLTPAPLDTGQVQYVLVAKDVEMEDSGR